VVDAADGDVAPALFARDAPDLIALDGSMPSVDGPEVRRRLTSDPAPRAILVPSPTAAPLDREQTAALDAGADASLAERFSPLELAGNA
jgi:CheY-like chemotaxis protein